MLSLLFVLCSFLATALLVDAFAIDKNTCKGKQEDLMFRAVKAAFDLSDGALEALETEPRDPNVDRLFRLLFGNVDIKPIVATFRGLQESNTMYDPEDIRMNNPNQVMFYCNLDRVTKGTRNGQARWIDSVTNTAFNDNQGEAVHTCKSALDVTLAVTWNPPTKVVQKPTGGFKSTRTPSQVTLCPWFIGWAVNARYQVWDDTSIKVIAATAAIPLLSNNPFKYPLTPFDAYGLLEKVILHELTHTAAGKRLDDVDMEVGGLPFMNVAYGWNAATNLVKQGASGESSPVRNSDSIALFASGVKLLGLAPPIYIENDGTMSKKMPTSRRRHVPSVFERRSTPVAFEGFMTRIRAAQAAVTVPAQYYE